MKTAEIFFLIILGMILLRGLFCIWQIFLNLPVKRAGKRGEIEAVRIIKEVLREGDILLANVPVSFMGKRTELDTVVVNSRGVFIIEVKNYRGELVGNTEDFMWTKYKRSRGGMLYQKQVRNPLRQVKRQVYLLSNYLRSRKIHVWIEGYVLFLEHNSPITSDRVLESSGDIDRALHRGENQKNPEETLSKIKNLLQESLI